MDNYEIGEEDIQNPIGKSDISIVPVITGAGGAGKLLLGAALIGAFLVYHDALDRFLVLVGDFCSSNAFKAGLYAIGIGASALGGALVLSGVSDMLFPLPKPPDFTNEEDPRISFSFSGIQNTSRAGTSHPIVYVVK